MINFLYLRIYPILTSIWFLAFTAQILRINHHAQVLSGQVQRIESLSRTIARDSQEISDLARQTRERAVEFESLLSLVNLIPQDRGFIRTQKVISDEVHSLRRKVSRWMGKDRIYIVIDSKANKLYLKKGLDLLFDADCSVGRGGILKDGLTGRTWEFVTPLGEFKIWKKIENPVWIKPDWAFVETRERVPAPSDPIRKVPGELGAYVLSLGDGYLIHGTKNEALLGRAVSHGCVRLGAKNLEVLYQTVPLGTKVYIY